MSLAYRIIHPRLKNPPINIESWTRRKESINSNITNLIKQSKIIVCERTSPTNFLPSILFSTSILPSFLPSFLPCSHLDISPSDSLLISLLACTDIDSNVFEEIQFRESFLPPLQISSRIRGARIGGRGHGIPCQRVKGDLRLLNIHNRETYGVTIDDPLGVGFSAGCNSSWTMDSGRITSSPVCCDDYGLPFCGYLKLNRISQPTCICVYIGCIAWHTLDSLHTCYVIMPRNATYFYQLRVLDSEDY